MHKFSLYRTCMDKKELICLACRGRYVGLSSFLLFGTGSTARTLQLSAEENNATYALIYMIMRCSCYAYACMQVFGAPSALFIYLLLRVCAWLFTKGYMQHRR